MTGRRPATRRSSPDTFAAIQAQMERAEAGRRRVLRLTAAVAALGTAAAVLAVAGVLASGAPAEPETANTSSPAPEATVTAAPELAAASVDPKPVGGPSGAPEPERTPGIEPERTPGIEPERTPDVEPELAKPSAPKQTVQRLELAIGAAGYEPGVLSAKAGVPIRLTVERGEGCAAGLLIPALGIEVDNSAADASVDLGALEAGDYRFTCGMEMVEGVLEVR